MWEEIYFNHTIPWCDPTQFELFLLHTLKTFTFHDTMFVQLDTTEEMLVIFVGLGVTMDTIVSYSLQMKI